LPTGRKLKLELQRRKSSRPTDDSEASSTRFFPDFAGKKRFAFGEQPFPTQVPFVTLGLMSLPDDFSNYVAHLLDGRYDCVDRIVLNGFGLIGIRHRRVAIVLAAP